MLTLDGAHEPAPGIVAWDALHPSWNREVTSVALESEGGLVLVDPLAPPALRDARRFWKALDRAVESARSTAVVLTLHHHERSAAAVAGRYGATVWAPAGSERRLALRPGRLFAAGDPLPGGLTAHATACPGEVVLWSAAQHALVFGDVVLGAGPRSRLRVCPASWLPRGVSRADVARSLEALRALPVDVLLPLHGAIVTDGAREALGRALDDAIR